MRFRHELYLLLILLIGLGKVNAQSYAIDYQDESILLAENIEAFDWKKMDRSNQIDRGYYVWLQFYETPKQSVQDKVASSAIELLEYIDNNTYLAFVPKATNSLLMKEYGVRSIHLVPEKYKLSRKLRFGDIGSWAIKGDRLHITFRHYDRVERAYALKVLKELDIRVEQSISKRSSIDLLIPSDCLDELVRLPFVKYIELVAPPAIRESDGSRNLHRASNLDTGIASDRNYDGSGIGVMVRDDGFVGPHIDFQGRIDNSATTNIGDEHGDGVAGIIAGAGNLSPNNRGMAAGANLYIVDYSSDFTTASTLDLIENNQVQVTNSSYGNGCNGGYTGTARIVDQQSIDHPVVLHVFSAGNSNNNNCGYGAGDQWGNITGGHKQGKNVIATSNCAADGVLIDASSRGPAYDGRIKPDITANGEQISTAEFNNYAVFGGTSGASPGIAGVAAQLYQAYRDLNEGELPEAALVKATLLNTASDYGNIGPDFKFGWGIVNALSAVKLLEDGRYIKSKITQGTTNSHIIEVPANTVQVRFMLYWNDPAATIGASKALVNDLDLKAVTPPRSNGSIDTLFPYVLRSEPDPNTLDFPAFRGEDHLNNMEQVVIDYPQPGPHTLNVEGFEIPLGPQDYYIVYEFITQEITLTHPTTRLELVSGRDVLIQWDAVNISGECTLHYSGDGGDSWQRISTVPVMQRVFGWTVPWDVSGQAMIRIEHELFEDVSDTTFCHAPQIQRVRVVNVCPNEMTFVWDSMPGFDTYDFYVLGEKYMELRGTTTATTITIPDLVVGTPVWYAISARDSATGTETRRTNAWFYNGGLMNCPLRLDVSVENIISDLSSFSAICSDLADSIVRVELYNNGIEDIMGFPITYQLGDRAPVTEVFTDTIAPGATKMFSFEEKLAVPVSDLYDLNVFVSADGDEYVFNDSLKQSIFISVTAKETPISENFDDNGYPLPNWLIINPDDRITWDSIEVVSAADTASVAVWIDNFSYNAPGAEDVIETEIIAIVDSTTLTFDIAKAQYSPVSSDVFRIDVSVDCGVTFDTVYYKEGLELSTLSNYNTNERWVPTSGTMWRTDSVDLSVYAGENVLIRFVNINGYGSSTIIDNINISSPLDTIISDIEAPSQLVDLGVDVYPNPARGKVYVRLPMDMASSNTAIDLINNMGQVMMSIQPSNLDAQMFVDTRDLKPGVYYLRIETKGTVSTKKIIVE